MSHPLHHHHPRPPISSYPIFLNSFSRYHPRRVKDVAKALAGTVVCLLAAERWDHCARCDVSDDLDGRPGFFDQLRQQTRDVFDRAWGRRRVL